MTFSRGVLWNIASSYLLFRYLYKRNKKTQIMLYKIILSAIILMYCYRCIPYLIAYYRLRSKGIKAMGRIESVNQNNWFIYWFWPSAPLTKFITEEGNEISNQPVSSLAINSNEYKEGRDCTVYYSPKNPNRFVIKSQIEIRTNILMLFIIITLTIQLIFQ